MYTLDQVIKKFKSIIRDLKKDKLSISLTKDMTIQYYEIIIKFLLLEHKYPYEVKKCGKPIYHYFMYNLPNISKDYFEYLYSPYNPVRFAIETFDSIEEIRLELKR